MWQKIRTMFGIRSDDENIDALREALRYERRFMKHIYIYDLDRGDVDDYLAKLLREVAVYHGRRKLMVVTDSVHESAHDLWYLLHKLKVRPPL